MKPDYIFLWVGICVNLLISACAVRAPEEKYDLLFTRSAKVGRVYRLAHHYIASGVFYYGPDAEGKMIEEQAMQRDWRIVYDFLIKSHDPTSGAYIIEVVIRGAEDRTGADTHVVALAGARVIIQMNDESIRYFKEGDVALTEEELKVIQSLHTRHGLYSEDCIYGPNRPVRVGEKWGINRAAYARHCNAIGMPPASPSDIDGWVHLSSVKDDIAYVRSLSSINLAALDPHHPAKAIMITIEEAMKFPLDEQGPLLRQEARIVSIIEPRSNDMGLIRSVLKMHLVTELISGDNGPALEIKDSCVTGEPEVGSQRGNTIYHPLAQGMDAPLSQGIALGGRLRGCRDEAATLSCKPTRRLRRSHSRGGSIADDWDYAPE